MATVEKFLTIAYNEVGYAEGPNNKNKYGAHFKQNNVPWCGLFVRWCAAEAGLKIPNPTFTPAGAEGFKSMHKWHTKGEPKPGDIIFFDFPHDGIDRISHVGIVVRANADGTVTTIEGNTTLPNQRGDERNGGGVAIKRRKPSEIVGWGRPEFKPAAHPIVALILAKLDHPAAKPTVAKKTVRTPK